MATVAEVLSLARQLSPAGQQEVARALARSGRSADLPIAGGPAPQSVAWVKAERGHAVLATDITTLEASFPAGPAAIAGIWADRLDVPLSSEEDR
jgi:hypothetical protein